VPNTSAGSNVGPEIDSAGMVGLLTFEKSLGIRIEFPPSAAIAEEFRAQARPQPSRATPHCPTSPEILISSTFFAQEQVGRGCLTCGG